MVRPVRLTFLLPILVVGALRAQSPAPLVAPTAVTPADGSLAVSSARRTEKPPVPRAISSDVAAQLAASRPKFTPIAPPPPPKPEEELPDLRETDKPKNTIVRLPKFIVQERQPAVFTERDIYSKKGLENLAMRRYLTETDRVLNRFKLPLFGTSNADRAMAMYAEDERLKNMSDVADRTNMVMKSNAADGAKVKSEAQDTFMRWQDIGWQGGKPK